jgi:hypothetical protein
MQEYLRPYHYWSFRARELRNLVKLWDDGAVKAAMLLVAVEFDKMAIVASKWRTGARVSRKDCDKHGTIIDDGDKIHVQWDGGATSYFRRGVWAG